MDYNITIESYTASFDFEKLFNVKSEYNGPLSNSKATVGFPGQADYSNNNILLTQKLSQPVGLVVVLHGHGAGVEEDQDDDEPEPGRSLKREGVSPNNKNLIKSLLCSIAVSRILISSPVSTVLYLPHLPLQLSRKVCQLTSQYLFVKSSLPSSLTLSVSQESVLTELNFFSLSACFFRAENKSCKEKPQKGEKSCPNLPL